MSYTTIRYFYPHGNDTERLDCTYKDWDRLEKALAYCYRYAKGNRFASVEIRDEKSNLVYEMLADGKVYSII